MKQLDAADQEEQRSVDDQTIHEKILWLKKKLAELKAMQAKVNEHPEKQVSTTDPDSRLMKTQGMTRAVCYNVQSAVDSKHHLIIAHEVTNKTDRGQLCLMGKQAQSALQEQAITVIADKGYFSAIDIKNSQDQGMSVLVSKGNTSGSEKNGIFDRSLFKYDAGKDIYLCPANQEMTYRHSGIEKGLTIKRYFLGIATCRACSLKPQCTNSNEMRRMARWEHQGQIDRMDELMTTMPNSMLIRKQTVEHPFGTIKSWMGATHFLTRGFKNVRTEMNLHVLAYNLKRMISIMGVRGLIGALQNQ
jgi:hypothetical protein